MPSRYFDRWKHAQDVFCKSIATLGWTIGTPGATEVACALRQVDQDDLPAGHSPETLAQLERTVAAFIATKNLYARNLEISLGKAAPEQRDAFAQRVQVLDTELKALESSLMARLATQRLAVARADALTLTARTMIVSTAAACDRARAFAVKAQHEGTAAYFNTHIQTAARDITQQIGNVDQLQARGFHLDHPEPTALVTVLQAWSSAGRRVNPSRPQNEKAEVLQELRAFTQAVQGVERWARGEP